MSLGFQGTITSGNSESQEQTDLGKDSTSKSSRNMEICKIIVIAVEKRAERS